MDNKRGRPGKKFIYEGVEYASVQEASKLLGIHPNTLKYRAKNSIGFNTNHVQVKVAGKWFNSVNAASDETGVSTDFIKQCIKVGILQTRSVDDLA